jgi:hypothetical protein
MMVRVIYNDLLTGKVQGSYIDQLIHENKILGFFRSDGYVRVGYDQLRSRGGEYKGTEKRHSASGSS